MDFFTPPPGHCTLLYFHGHAPNYPVAALLREHPVDVAWRRGGRPLIVILLLLTFFRWTPAVVVGRRAMLANLYNYMGDIIFWGWARMVNKIVYESVADAATEHVSHLIEINYT